MASQVRAPFPYFGGKQAMVKHLLPLLPPHEVYVEVFGGAGSLLFAKPAAALEVFNDIDSGLVNFFRVLRNRADCAELQRQLDLTPYAREEYEFARLHWQDTADDIERARRWFIAVRQAFSGHFGRSGWKRSNTPDGHAVRSYRAGIDQFGEFCARLRYVQIENEPFERSIHAYDAPDVLFYCDPPYVPETRRDGGYRHEMTIDQHRQLLELVKNCRGMIVLSGYHCPLYDEMLTDWECLEVEVYAQSAAKTHATGLKGRGAMQAQTRTECIWIKPNTIKASAPDPQLSLFTEVA